jgi:hypothetical protein
MDTEASASGWNANGQCADCTTYGNNAYVSYGFTFGETGALTTDSDTATLLNGTSYTSIVSPVTAPLSLSGAFSAEGWFFPLDIGSGKKVIYCSVAINMIIYHDTDDKLYVFFETSAGSFTQEITPLTNSIWYYVVFTWDGSQAIFYLNGAPVYTKAISGTFPITGQCTNIGSNGTLGGGTPSDFANAVVDEWAFYPYNLTPARVAYHYLVATETPPAPSGGPPAGNDAQFWQLAIYDKDGNLLDIPQDDVKSITAEDSLNGGSSTAKIVLHRPINLQGVQGPSNTPVVQFQNRVFLWVWNGRISRPLNPWWSGYIQDIDEEKLKTDGEITLSCQGDASILDHAVIDMNINPGIGGNPNLDCAVFLNFLFVNYAPPGFGVFLLPPEMFDLDCLQLQQMKLGQAIDTTIKSGVTDAGATFVWHVRSDMSLTRTLTVQVDQDPNSVGGATFRHVFVGDSTSQYKLSTRWRDIVNVVAVIGGTDPDTGQQVQSVYEDVDSVNAYGPIEDQISVQEVRTIAACNAYGKYYLDQKANPTAQGSIILLVPDPEMLAGQWIQVWELPGVETDPESFQNLLTIKQFRLGTVTVDITSKTRVTMTLAPTAPTPYLDHALYQLGQNTQSQANSLVTTRPVRQNQMYILGGGVTGTS